MLFQLMFPEGMTCFFSSLYKSLLREITCKQGCFCQTEVKVVSRGMERQKDRERDLMGVSASADKFPPERLLVAIETPGEERKKKVESRKKHVFSC